jgi:hypothetical protein
MRCENRQGRRHTAPMEIVLLLVLIGVVLWATGHMVVH